RLRPRAFPTRRASDLAEKLDTLVFDKTGTLTRGEPEVTEVLSGHPQELLRIAAALETKSEHPLARAIMKKAGGPLLPVADFRSQDRKSTRLNSSHEWI